MKKYLAIFGFFLFGGLAANAQTADKITWLSWDEAALKMEKAPKKLLVDVYTDWCGWCKRMDATTMVDPEVIKLVNQYFYAVKLDGEGKKDILFKGRTFKFVAQGTRGYHELPAELMGGKMSYPTIVYLNEKFEIIQAVPGYQTAVDIQPILAYFGSNAFATKTWDEFKASYRK